MCKADAIKSGKRPSLLHVSMCDWWPVAIFGDLFLECEHKLCSLGGEAR